MPCIHAMELYIVNYNIGMADIWGGDAAAEVEEVLGGVEPNVG